VSRKPGAVQALQAQMAPQVMSWLGAELYSTEAVAQRRELVASQAIYQSVAINLALAPGADAQAADLAAASVLRLKNLAADEDAYLAHLSRASADPQIHAAADRVRALHRQRAQLFQSGAPAAEVEQTAHDLDAAELALGKVSRAYASQLQVRDIHLPDVTGALRALPARSALLEMRQYSPIDWRTGELGAARWAGILVRGDAPVLVRDLGTVADSDAAVAAQFADMTIRTRRRTAAALYQQLIAPYAPDLGHVERLYVAPDGVLALVSFGLLEDDGKPLIERMDVRLLQSGRDLLRPPSAQPARGLVAVGGIDFDDVAPQPSPQPGGVADIDRLRGATADALRAGFPPLPESGREVADIAALYRAARPGETVSVAPSAADPQPTKSWLLSLPPPRALHLATHGFYLSEKVAADRPMLLVGIAMAGANRMLREGGQDGILYALEAQDLDLEGTEIVVLSACDTAQGQYDYGDGVAGLVRALRTAGARRVLVTLRPVVDRSATEFMARFYRHWLAQSVSDPGAALLATQRDYLEDTSGASDQTWTAFIVVGG
jgi:CHAT domain-containing protein